MKNNQDKKYKTDLICPITNSPLWYIGTEHWVMDPDSFYSPESDSNIIFARHPFCYNLFRQVTDKTSCSTELRIFRLNDDNSWTELKYAPHTSYLFPINTSEDDPEWIEAVNKGIEVNRKNIEIEKYWDEHPDEDPRVKSYTIPMELVEVKPLPPPSAKIFYMDYTYSSNWFTKLIRKIKNKFKNITLK